MTYVATLDGDVYIYNTEATALIIQLLLSTGIVVVSVRVREYNGCLFCLQFLCAEKVIFVVFCLNS